MLGVLGRKSTRDSSHNHCNFPDKVNGVDCAQPTDQYSHQDMMSTTALPIQVPTPREDNSPAKLPDSPKRTLQIGLTLSPRSQHVNSALTLPSLSPIRFDIQAYDNMLSCVAVRLLEHGICIDPDHVSYLDNDEERIRWLNIFTEEELQSDSGIDEYKWRDWILRYLFRETRARIVEE